DAFARRNGAAPVGGRYRKVEVDDLKELAKSFESLIGPANPRLVLRALRLYSGFDDLNYLVDNSRLPKEAISAPPRVTDYLDGGVRASSAVSIPAQMQWDVK
ncbi:cationic peptide resistance protein CprA, partial [Pseudomonas aeruginosa]